MNDAGYLFGYFHHYLACYVASNAESFLSGSLPSNELGSVPRSLPSYSPLSRASSFPEYSTRNLETNVRSFLAKYEESCDMRRGASYAGPDSAGLGTTA